MQCIDCIFIKKCGLYHLFMLSLQLEQNKSKDYGQECEKYLSPPKLVGKDKKGSDK